MTYRWVPICFGLLPLLVTSITWDTSGAHSAFQVWTRTYAWPLLLFELVVVFAAYYSPARTAMLRAVRPHGVAFPLLVLLAVAYWSAVATAPEQSTAVLRTSAYVVHGLFALALWSLDDNGASCGTLSDWFTLGAIGVFGTIAVLALVTPNTAPFDWNSDLPLVNNIRHLGYYAATLFAVAASRYVVGDTPLTSRVAALVGVFVAVVAVLWSGTRGAIFAIIAGLAAGLLVVPAMRHARRLLIVGAIAVIAMGAALLLPAKADNMGAMRVYTATVGAGTYGISNGRTLVWQESWQAIEQSPLFGHGEGQMPYFVTHHFGTIQPHNIVLQVLLAWGFVGLTCVALVLAPLCIGAVRSAADAANAAATAPFVAITTLAAYGMIDGTLFHVLPLGWFAAMFALTLTSASRVATTRDELSAAAAARDT